MSSGYGQYLIDTGPGWWDVFSGLLWLEGHGLTLDEVSAIAQAAVSARIITAGPMDAVYTLGAERGIDTFSKEPQDSYRARVQGAWQFWQWAGTNTGIKLVLAQLGYEATIYEHFRTDPLTRWAEFSIDLTARDVTASTARYEDGVTFYDDGTPFDLTIRAAEPERIRGIIDRVKSAHSKLARLTFTASVGVSGHYDDPGLTYDNGQDFPNITTIEL